MTAVPTLLPRPARLTTGEGSYLLTAETALIATGAALPEADYLAETLSRATGWTLRPGNDGAGIRLELDPAATDLGAEGYRLQVRAEGVLLLAATAAGLFYGVQTLLQLLPPDVYRTAAVPGVAWKLPCCEIEDRPRFGWRGLMLDCARHFLPKTDILRFVDALALHKMNRLHLHLTEDQGWRLEVKKYPRLTEHGAWRPETLVGHYRQQPWIFDGVPHGGYYTQDDLREIVAYAARRHIVVIPEVEMPGHARAWISAYPEVGCFPERQQGIEPWTRWGISEDVIAPRPAVVQMCKDILTEVMDIFPSPWIHIGGDEAPRTHWKESEEVQALIKELGLADEDGLQAWFTSEMSRFLADHGRKLIGWDEILEGGLAPGATVMSWRGEKGGIAAAGAGHEVVMSPSPWVYLDNCQGPQDEERVGIGGYVSLAKTYAYDPLPPALPADKHHYILGLQGNLWSEYIPNPQHLGYMAFPRGSAIAEIDWSPAGERDLGDFLYRFQHHQQRLAALGLSYRPLARRLIRECKGQAVAEAATAMLHGNAIRRHAEDGYLGEWTSAEALVTWEVMVATEGDYEVSITLASSDDAAGSSFVAEVAGQPLPGTVPATGGEPRSIALGKVNLPAGRHLVAVRVTELASEAAMNLHRVVLSR
ncbi:MAG: family 20 glycosylhydrolase [Armatimonadetes bacterium]|nr:family 20 glycosylhydrolase [Armatimonadota bacterium]